MPWNILSFADQEG